MKAHANVKRQFWLKESNIRELSIFFKYRFRLIYIKMGKVAKKKLKRRPHMEELLNQLQLHH